MASNEAYNDIHRYEVRTSYGRDKQTDKTIEGTYRNSEKELFANCARIEPLSAGARRQYLSGLQGAYDSVKMAFQEALDKDAFKPFYGIISPDEVSKFGIEFSSEWKEEGGDFLSTMNVLTQNPLFASAIGATLGSTIGGVIGGENAAAAGMMLGGFGSALTSSIHNGMNALLKKSNENDSTMYKLGKSIHHTEFAMSGMIGKTDDGTDIYGMNSGGTGASTMKRFVKPSISFNKTLTFNWYMPEQEDLFRLSIRRLLKLAYVRSLYDNPEHLENRLAAAASRVQSRTFIEMAEMGREIKNIGTNAKNTLERANDYIDNDINILRTVAPNLADGLGTAANLANGLASDGGNWISDVLNLGFDNMNNVSNNLQSNGTYSTNGENTGLESGMKAQSDLIASFLATLNQTDSFFGKNNVAIPLPVRLTVGNILDIEPLVITNVDIKPSKETFVNRIGAHIPVTMSVTVTFGMWLTPGPNHQFMQLLGDNVFSTYYMK